MSAVVPAQVDESALLRRFWCAARGYWSGRSAVTAWGLTALLIVTVLLQLLTQYRLNIWNRDFFNAVGLKDGAELARQAWRFLPLAALSLALALISVWGRMTMQRTWRRWISRNLYGFWLGQDHFRGLRFMPGDHQAPEYRIAEDARIATDFPVDLVIGLLASILSGITFIGVLWRVGGSIEIDGLGFSVPGYLVVAVIVYSVLIAIATIAIGYRLTAVMQQNKWVEADLRATGTHLREVGEGKMPNGETPDLVHRISRALDAVIENWRLYMWQLVRVTVVTHSSFLLTPVVAILLCMPKYVGGEMSLGEVVQASAAFAVVQGACNWFTENYPKLAEWAASANRVASLLIALDEMQNGGAAATTGVVPPASANAPAKA